MFVFECAFLFLACRKSGFSCFQYSLFKMCFSITPINLYSGIFFFKLKYMFFWLKACVCLHVLTFYLRWLVLCEGPDAFFLWLWIGFIASLWLWYLILNFVNSWLDGMFLKYGNLKIGRLRMVQWLLQSQSQWPVKISTDFYALRMRCNISVT